MPLPVTIKPVPACYHAECGEPLILKRKVLFCPECNESVVSDDVVEE